MKRIFHRGSLTRWDTLVEPDGGSETMELLAIFKLQIGPVLTCLNMFGRANGC